MKKRAMSLLVFLLLILILLLWYFTKAFATLHSAGSLLQIPKKDNNYVEVDSKEIQVIQRYLPTGATLISSSEDSEDEVIRKIDLNGDGREELIYSYKNYGSEDSISVSVLYCEDGIWYNAFQIDKELLDLDQILFADVTGDGNAELLIGWKENNSEWNGLDIYTWSNKTLKDIYSTAYSKFKIDSQRGDLVFGDRDRVVIWKENNLFYDAEVITWNNANFVEISKYYPKDFTELVSFYNDMEASNSENSEYWYARASACMMAEDYAQAQELIERALSFDITPSKRLTYQVVLGNCQAQQEHNEGQKTLLDVINEIGKMKDVERKNKLLMDAYYYLGDYYFIKENFLDAYTNFDMSMKSCQLLFADNEEKLKLYLYQITRARTEAAALSFSKTKAQ